jgi:hypothetical protein
MADVERMKRALVNAHKAGDTAAAKTLARAIKASQGGTPQQAAPSVAADVAKSVPSALARGTMDLVGLPGTIGDTLQYGFEKAMDYVLPGPDVADKMKPSPFSGSSIRGAASDLTGGATEYQPQTTAGKYAGTISEFLPGAAAFGGVNPANLLRFGALPGAASEAAGQATEGTAVEPYARVAAALVAPAAPAMASRAITPIGVNPERAKLLQTLKAEGVPVTGGQATGSNTLRYAESELGGMRAQNFTEMQGEAFTRAALKKAGISAERASPEVMDNAFTTIGRQFDDLSARNPLVLDAQLATDLRGAFQEYASLVNPTQRAPIVKDMIQDVAQRLSGGQPLSGEAYKAIRSRLDKAARGSKSDPELSDALFSIRNALDDAVERNIVANNPADAGAWKEVRRNYRNMIALENASVGAGENAALGLISPAQLRSATVRQNKRDYVRGKGDLADLARAGEGIMRPMPQSGTAPRTAMRNMGAAMPTILGGLAGGAVGNIPGAAAGAVLGTLAPSAVGAALMSRPGRAYLSNQAIKPLSVGDSRNAAVIAALLGENLPRVSGERR